MAMKDRDASRTLRLAVDISLIYCGDERSHDADSSQQRVTMTTITMSSDWMLALLPLSIPFFIICTFLSPLQAIREIFDRKYSTVVELWAYCLMALLGYRLTSRLIPTIKEYLLRKNIFGKDMGKRGTAAADVPM